VRARHSSPRARSRPEGDTRARLLEAGKRLFADHGFDDVTVRDICREADASLALVNYHFGDKAGLYAEVMEEAIRALRQFNDQLMAASPGSPPEKKLEHFVRVFLARVLQPLGAAAWVHQLMEHEIRRPTAAAPRIGRLAVRPRIRYLGEVIGELMTRPPDDPLVMQCVGSVHGLCLIYARYMEMPESLRAAVTERPWKGALDVDACTKHVLAFSLAGIRVVAER
jgi:TetR/AcrR family transcriptional regulator, regulator of cefoperazone and chloramphenicol sensitivity